MHIGVARGAQGARAPPGCRKKFGAKITGKSCKYTPDRECTPEAEQECNLVQFVEEIGEICDGGRGCLGSFSVCFEGDD